MTASARASLASVVVALNPHEHAFGAVMDAWAAQAGAGDYEVVVVHDGSRPEVDDEYRDHRARHPSSPVRLIDSPVPGRAASNNAGVRATRGALILFVADDFRPSPGLVAAHRRFQSLLDAPAAGIGPAYFVGALRDDPFRRWLEDDGMNFGVAFPTAAFGWKDDYFYVGNASIARETFDRVGAFDERFRHDLFDDFEFSLRLRERGVPTRFVPRAVAWHDHEVTFDYRLESSRRLGEAAAIYESTSTGPWPWSPLTAQAIVSFEAAEREEAQRAPTAPTIGASRKRWEIAFNLAFLRGYHAARRGAGPG